MQTEPIFIDFEASSLAVNSYPIEIAWGGLNHRLEEYLISPESVLYWNDWSPIAEKIHGIQRELLLQNGSEPRFVAQRINEALTSMDVYSDNPDFDAMWMKALFDAVNMPYPKINLLHFDSLLINIVCPDIGRRIEFLPKLIEFKKQARAQIRYQHRAGYDVQYLKRVWEIAKSFAGNN